MKTLVNYGLMIALAFFMSGCFAEKSYIGKVNVLAVGAGAKPTSQDKHYVSESVLPSIVVGYTPALTIEEQDVSDTVKYVSGDALSKIYSGEPKFLADYLNSYQKLENKVVILDKNGVVAWSGSFGGRSTSDINEDTGVYDYGLTGVDMMSFEEAMEKFVIDGDTTDFDDDKKIEFPKGTKESFMSNFSYSKSNPLLFTKLPNMTIENSSGSIDLSKTIGNNKPTVLVFFMSKSKESKSLLNDVENATDMLGMLKGGRTVKKASTPAVVLQQLQDKYLTK